MTLSDVCELIVDCPHTTAPDEGVGIPLIRTPNIGIGRFELEGVHRVSEAVYQERISRAVPQDDDIIFAREAPVGNAAIIKNGQKMCLGQRTVLIRPDKKKAWPDYLVYYLLAPLQQYKLLGTANGATVAHVNLPMIRGMKVDNLPSLSEQRRIADILSAYDDLVENNRKQIKLLEEAAQRLYKEWFIDLHFPGYEHTKIVNGLPEGWKFCSISQIVDIYSGFAFKSSAFTAEGKYKIVTIKNVHDGVFNGDDVSQINSIPDKMPLYCVLKDEDILLSLTGNVGRVCLCYGANFLLNQRVAKLQSKYVTFTYCLFRSKDMFDAMNSMANGAAQQNLSPIRTAEYKIQVPEEKILLYFEERTKNILQSIIVLNKQILNLKNTRDQLLLRLMNKKTQIKEKTNEPC